MSDSNETTVLVDRAGRGDPRALGELLTRHQERLHRIVSFRIDRRLRSRVDPGDVVQEAYVEATTRFERYLADDRKMPFFVWLRFLTLQKLAELHRHHLGVQARDAQREVSIHNGPAPQATSAVLAAQLLGRFTSPSQAAIRFETKMRLEQKLNEMDAIDREILALRHFEQLTNGEIAGVLEIAESAASNRYLRAVKRLQQALKSTGTEQQTP